VNIKPPSINIARFTKYRVFFLVFYFNRLLRLLYFFENATF